MQTTASRILVSSCLTGLCTRYDGQCKPSTACMQQLAGRFWIPVCPEQLGGLPTPRDAAELIGGNGSDVLAGLANVVTGHGKDVTRQFIRGAEQSLMIARAQCISLAFLKSRSPSCGVNRLGVTAALLRENGVEIVEF